MDNEDVSNTGATNTGDARGVARPLNKLSNPISLSTAAEGVYDLAVKVSTNLDPHSTVLGSSRQLLAQGDDLEALKTHLGTTPVHLVINDLAEAIASSQIGATRGAKPIKLTQNDVTTMIMEYMPQLLAELGAPASATQESEDGQETTRKATTLSQTLLKQVRALQAAVITTEKRDAEKERSSLLSSKGRQLTRISQERDEMLQTLDATSKQHKDATDVNAHIEVLDNKL